jgi:hypothetical protein
MMNILRRMKLWQKFAALGAISAVMCAIPLVQLVQYKQGELAVAKAEDEGLGPVRTLVSLQKNLQAHRGLSAMVLAGNAAVDAERRARQTDVNAQFAALDKHLQSLGYTKAIEPAKAMKTGWEQLSQKVDSRSISAKDSFDAHTALVDQNIGMMELVADASGLSLDPVAESYFVMTAAGRGHRAAASDRARGAGRQGPVTHAARRPDPPVARHPSAADTLHQPACQGRRDRPHGRQGAGPEHEGGREERRHPARHR